MRLGAHHETVRPPRVVAAPTAVADQMFWRQLHDGWLDVAQPRTDRRRWRPLAGLRMMAQEQRRAVRAHEFRIVALLVIDRQQKIAVVEHDGLVAHHHARLEREHERIAPRAGAVIRNLAVDARAGPRLAVTHHVKQPDAPGRPLPVSGASAAAADSARLGAGRAGEGHQQGRPA